MQVFTRVKKCYFDQNIGLTTKSMKLGVIFQIPSFFFFFVNGCISGGQLSGAGRPNSIQHYVKSGTQNHDSLK